MFQKDFDQHMAVSLNFCEATKVQLEGLQKDDENLRTEIIVLCQVVATLGSTRGNRLSLKFWNLKPSVAQGVLKNGKISFGIWNNFLLLEGCLKRTS